MEQASSRGHEASPQSGLGVGCKWCSSSKKLRGLSVRAQARCISISLSFSVAFFFSSFLSPLSAGGAKAGPARVPARQSGGAALGLVGAAVTWAETPVVQGATSAGT